MGQFNTFNEYKRIDICRKGMLGGRKLRIQSLNCKSQATQKQQRISYNNSIELIILFIILILLFTNGI